MCQRRFDDNSYTRMQFLRAVSHSVGAHSSKLYGGPTDSDSNTSSDEEQPDADASTNADVETVATTASDSNDCNVCIVYLVTLSRLWHVATNVLPRNALVHSAVLRLHVVRLSVCPSVCDVGGLGLICKWCSKVTLNHRWWVTDSDDSTCMITAIRY